MTFQHISDLARTYSRDRRVIIGALAAALILGGVLYISKRADDAFAQRYAAYAELAVQSTNATLLPGAQNSTLRQQLNLDLTQALGNKLSSAQRLKVSEDGLQVLDESTKQIDTIGTIGEQLAVQIQKMDLIANGASDFAKKDTMRKIVALAKRKAEVTQDIRGLSYRANFETKKIFDRIIADKGALTQAHIKDMNDELPTAEAQFDKRTNLYNDLQALDEQIAEAGRTL